MPISSQTLGGQTKKSNGICLCLLGTTAASKGGKIPLQRFGSYRLQLQTNVITNWVVRKYKTKGEGVCGIVTDPNSLSFLLFLTPQAISRGLLDLVLSIPLCSIPGFWLHWGSWWFDDISKSDVLLQCACCYLHHAFCPGFTFIWKKGVLSVYAILSNQKILPLFKQVKDPVLPSFKFGVIGSISLMNFSNRSQVIKTQKIYLLLQTLSQRVLLAKLMATKMTEASMTCTSVKCEVSVYLSSTRPHQGLGYHLTRANTLKTDIAHSTCK